jgi:hypothetical protein
VYLKKSELILRAIGSAGGRAKTEPPFRPPRLEAEAKRTISSFSIHSANYEILTNFSFGGKFFKYSKYTFRQT